jgi:hypothetical protein
MSLTASGGADAAQQEMDAIIRLLQSGGISKANARVRMAKLSHTLAARSSNNRINNVCSDPVPSLGVGPTTGGAASSTTDFSNVPAAALVNVMIPEKECPGGKGAGSGAKNGFDAEQRRALVLKLMERQRKRPLQSQKKRVVPAHMKLSDDTECTFEPRQFSAPCSPSSAYAAATASPSSKSLYDRGMEMKGKIENIAKSRRVEEEKAELSLCTFHPQTLTSSRGGGDSRANRTDVAERLYNQRKEIAGKKERAREEQLKRESAELTFSPRLAWTSGQDGDADEPQDPFQHVKTRYDKPSKGGSRVQAAPSWPFSPQVIGLKPGMEIAQQYCAVPIHERLHKRPEVYPSRTAAECCRREQDEDDMNATGDTATLSLPGSSSARGERRQTFSQFLSGLTKYEKRRKSKREQLIRQNTPSFSPTLSEETRRIVQEKGLDRTQFLERLGMSLMRKERRFKQLTAEISRRDKEVCTFTPQIIGSTSRGRSTVELSSGDVGRREYRRRMNWQRLQHDPYLFPTFKPSLPTLLSGLAPQVPGKLRIASDLGSLMYRIGLKSAERQRERDRAHHRKQMQDLQECTFVPTVLSCPEYIKRTAESMRLLREQKLLEEASQGANSTKTKPEWR